MDDPQEAAAPALLSSTAFADADEQAAALRGWNQSYLQLSRGAFGGEVRQLEFSLFDFELHATHGDGRGVLDVLEAIRSEVAVMRPPVFNRFANSFAHIFAGGYAAGYYSYKWAEVLSADAFSRFEEEGVLNPATGRAFREAILARGGSQEPMVLFVDFRGREPSIDALLRHSGLTEDAA